jgi:hypothetical protein
MSLFDVIKYQLSFPVPTQSELEALPVEFFEEYKQKAGFIHTQTAVSVAAAFRIFATDAEEDIALLRKMLADRQEPEE